MKGSLTQNLSEMFVPNFAKYISKSKVIFCDLFSKTIKLQSCNKEVNFAEQKRLREV